MSLGNFNGGIIEDTSVKLIINKLELYIENEEKIVRNIKSSLSSLQDFYSGDNKSTVNSKINNLISSLNVMLDNRNDYVDSLRQVVDGYVKADLSNASKFNKKGIN